MRLVTHRALFQRIDAVRAKRTAKRAGNGVQPFLGSWTLFPMDDDDADRAERLFYYTPNRTPEEEAELRAIFERWPEAEGKLTTYAPTRKGWYLRISSADWRL
jgi:hypothetical protein